MNDLRYTIIIGFDEHELQFSPDGWDDSTYTIERSAKLYGIFRTYSVKLKFLKDGAFHLRSVYYAGDNDAKLRIERLNRMSFEYETKFVGKFDFSTFVDSDNIVEITVLDSSLNMMLKSNMDTDYEIHFASSNEFTIYNFPSRSFKYVHFSQILYWLLDRITESGLSSSQYALDMSELQALETNDLKTVITNSKALRGFYMGYITTSFAKLARTIYVLFDLTIGVEVRDGVETIVLKKTDDVFTDDVIISKANVTDFKATPAKEYIGNEVKIGHPSQDYDSETSTGTEFNGTTVFKFAKSLNVNESFELVTAYRSDYQGIYDHVVMYTQPIEENEIFVVCLKKYPLRPLELERGQQKQNEVVKPAFNCRISPKALAYLHSNFITSMTLASENALVFVSSDYSNYLNYTKTDSEDVFRFEGDGYDMAGNALFKPLYFEFTTDISSEEVDLLNANPNSRIEFSFKGNNYSGFLLNVAVKLHKKCSAKFKLLCAPDVDITQLIR